MSDFLKGKNILDIKIAEDSKAILFKCDDGDHVVLADADCCSETWIEHIETPAGGFPCHVFSTKELDLGEITKHDYDVIALYGYKIETSKGDIDIDFRNASNGYYGGNLVWPDEEGSFYGGVHGQNVSDQKWIDLEEK